MSVYGEEDLCRVCRSEGSKEDPLFYPCKCSGTIRYVHQECLMEWLNHSQKKHCELCKTPFQFTKLYDPAMPKTLPFRQLSRKMVSDVRSGLLVLLRWLLVGFVWLGWLPYCTRHIWRSTLKVGDHITTNSSGHLHTLVNMTVSSVNGTIDVPDHDGKDIDSFLPLTLTNLTHSATANKIITEVCEGQIITSGIVVVFVVVFLIREWIIQNNANLLDEAPEFLNRRGGPRRARNARLLAGARGADARVAGNHEPTAAAADAVQGLLESAANPEPAAAVVDNLEPRTLIERQPANDSSDWDNLRAQAARNSRRQRHSFADADSEEVASNTDAEDCLVAGNVNPADDSALNAAQMRELRRQAVLRATTRRIEHDEVASSQQPEPKTSEADPTLSSLHRQQQVTELDKELALEEGQPSVLDARERKARRRSLERKAWEESSGDFGEVYPDSPMPAPQPTELNPEILSLSGLDDEAGSRNPTIDPVIPGSHDPMTPDAESSGVIDASLASAESLPGSQGIPLTDDQLDSLLAQVRAAPNSLERTQVANSAIQACLDAAELIRAGAPIDRDSPSHRGTLAQIGVIAMAANEYGIERALDLDRAFQLAEEAPQLPVARTVAEAAAINNIVDVDNEAIRDLQRALPDQDELAIRDDMDDDIEGLLELVGVRGPIVALLQNSMLVVVMVTAFIVFGICVPHMYGRIVLAIASDPINYLYKMPMTAATVMLHELCALAQLTLRGAKILSSPVLKHSRVIKYADLLIRKASNAIGAGIPVLDWGLYRSHAKYSQQVALQIVRHGFSKYLSPHLKEHVTSKVPPLKAVLPERLTILLCGYTGLAVTGALYLRLNQRVTSGEQGKHIELAIRSFLRQSGYVMKFISILGIELFIFPLYCGLLLDAVFLPVFNKTDFLSRVAFLMYYPLTSLFLHWLVGTVYMFNFALFVSMCREIVRPGVLFFIRDPNDPAFNPIKDILERSVRSQMRKIGVSILIYSALIIGAFGSVVWAVARFVHGILPLKLSTSEPLFEVPFDLLLFQILLPLTYKFIKPQERIKAIWSQWFLTTSEALRLSQFMMGTRREDEEGHIRGVHGFLRQLLRAPALSSDPSFVRDGSFRRVPATDRLPMRVGGHMILRVTAENELLDTTTEDDFKDDTNYTVVYAPPHFRIRLYCFIFLLWAFSAAFAVSCTVIPLMFGRRIFKYISPQTQMHDLFAFLYGAYALGCTIFVMNIISKAGSSSQSAWTYLADLSNRRELKASCVMWSQFCLRWAYLIGSLSIFVPTLLGLCLEVYIIIPLGIWFNPGSTPTIHLVHDWIVGLVYVKIVGRTALVMPNSRLGQALNDTLRNDWRTGWRRPDLAVATRKLILPTAVSLLSALLVPLSIGFLARQTVYRGSSPDTGTLIYRMSYPAALISAALILLIRVAHILIVKWRAQIRDALYLKGRQLHNFGEAKMPLTNEAMTQNAPPRLPDVEEVESIVDELVRTIEHEESATEDVTDRTVAT